MGLATRLSETAATRPAVRSRRIEDEILPSLDDDDREALLAALRSSLSPGRIVKALKDEGVPCSEGAVRYWRENNGAR